MQSYFTNVRITGQWGQYVSMLFSKLCRDDASRRNRVEPTKAKQTTLRLLDARGFYGRAGNAASLDLVAGPRNLNACTRDVESEALNLKP